MRPIDSYFPPVSAGTTPAAAAAEQPAVAAAEQPAVAAAQPALVLSPPPKAATPGGLSTLYAVNCGDGVDQTLINEGLRALVSDQLAQRELRGGKPGTPLAIKVGGAGGRTVHARVAVEEMYPPEIFEKTKYLLAYGIPSARQGAAAEQAVMAEASLLTGLNLVNTRLIVSEYEHRAVDKNGTVGGDQCVYVVIVKDSVDPDFDAAMATFKIANPAIFAHTKRATGTDKRTLGLDKTSLGLDKTSLGLDKRTLGLDKRTLGLDKRTLGLDKTSLGLDKRTLGLSVRFDGGKINGKKMAPKEKVLLLKNAGVAKPPTVNGVRRAWSSKTGMTINHPSAQKVLAAWDFS